jgi:curved DNA-binding protein CbpA
VSPDPNRLPRLVEGLDLRALPISPAEAFVLSRVDGSSSELEIASATGLEANQVTATLSRLAELGAVRFVTTSSERPRMPPRSSTPASRMTIRPAVEAQAQSVHISEHPGSSARYDPKELEEAADLEPDRKRRILDVFYRLETLSHYEILEVEPSADRRLIKARYYEVVNVFHPDRYFGRSLGSFKPKLEKIFQRITEAHDILTRSEARSEYDAYLARHRGTEALHKLLTDEQARAKELREIEDRILAEARIGDRNDSLRPSASQIAPRLATPAPPAQGRPSDPGRASLTETRGSDPAQRASSDTADLRRRVLARKLGGSLPPPGSRAAPAPPPVPSSPESRERAVQELKRRYEERLLEARRKKAAEYVAQADADLGRNNLADAVNSLRIATSLVPGDDRLSGRVRELEARARRDLSERYLEQASYEEREGRFHDALRSYTRALPGSPSPALHDRIAHCLLAVGGDAKKAIEHARNAVKEAQDKPAFRLTLARAFIAANMTESALAELERAKTLAPSDDTITNLIRRLKRGA